MSIEFEEYNQLVYRDQRTCQIDKRQVRGIEEYDNYLFENPYLPALQPGVSEFWLRSCGKPISNLIDLLGSLRDIRSRRIHWVDMCGGYGISMRQVSIMMGQHKPRMTLVDIINPQKISNQLIKRAIIRSFHPEIANPIHRPTLIVDNAEFAQLPMPADVLTSVEAIQYLNDPLAALCNWYNQMTDNGILMIAAEHCWSTGITHATSDQTQYPLEAILNRFQENEILFVVDGETIPARYEQRPHLHFNRLIVCKKPNTMLQLHSSPLEILTDSYGYKTTVYDSPEPIEVQTNSATSKVEQSQEYFKLMRTLLQGNAKRS